MERQVLAGDDLFPAEDDGPFDDIFELPHVSRIGIAQEEGPCLFRYIGDHFLILFRVFFQEVVDQKGDVLLPLAKGRQVDRNHIKPVVEVFPEESLLHSLFEIAVRGSDHPHIRFEVASTPPARAPSPEGPSAA